MKSAQEYLPTEPRSSGATSYYPAFEDSSQAGWGCFPGEAQSLSSPIETNSKENFQGNMRVCAKCCFVRRILYPVFPEKLNASKQKYFGRPP